MIPLPQVLLDELQSIPNINVERFIEAHSQAPPTSIRLNPHKPTSQLFDVAGNVPWCQWGRYLTERPIFTLDPLFHAGTYYVQEASSMFVQACIQQLFPSSQHLKILDLCAAPGGKSTLLSGYFDATNLIVSNEVIRTRASILEENIVKWGCSNQWVTCNDPKDFQKLKGYFDLVVVDAPCSGSGLFRKDDFALKSWSEANVHLCAARQKRIIADIWESIKEDGVLLYATCSYSIEEDEALLDWIASVFSVESIEIDSSAYNGIIHTITSKHKMHGYRFIPGQVQGEGFFISAIRKKDSAATIKYPNYKSIPKNKWSIQTASILQAEDWAFIEGKEALIALPEHMEADFHLLRQQIYLRKFGVALGVFTPKEWIPHHETALSVSRHKDLPIVHVDKETALRFLKKETLIDMNINKGWYLVAYKGWALGWIKSIGNRINNYLPKNQRIRMELPSEFHENNQ
ncbi:MAG TPA: RNA methyltransferase [Flavipsychrobacter sp.]|nr:RNA methyltransferase [Flavipsychrobacter sp.]